jgi:signal transduction histidine kinase
VPAIPPLLRRLVTRPAGIVAASAALALALAGIGWLDHAATRRELMHITRELAASLGDTVAAAARVNRAAMREAESALAERLLDNVRLLVELDRASLVTPALLEDLVARNRLFRVSMVGPRGERELQVGPPGTRRGPGTTDAGAHPGPRAGAGPWRAEPGRVGSGPGGGLGRGAPPGPGAGVPGGGELLGELLSGRQTEAVTAVHETRGPGAAAVGRPGRLAAGARRANGGAILINVDASELLELQRQSSLDRLLQEVATTTDAVAYVVFEADGVRYTHGPAPADAGAAGPAPAAAPGAVSPGEDASSSAGPSASTHRTGVGAPGPTPSEIERSVGRRRVLEIRKTIDLDAGAPARLTLGMGLDALVHAEQRLAARLAVSLSASAALGVLAVGLVWLRRQYGALSVAHRRAREALRQRDRLAAMGEMAAVVAHEIRNPLNAITMSAQRLRREAEAGGCAGAFDDEARGLVAIIHDEARRIDAKVGEFLRVARPAPLVARRASLSDLVRQVVDGRRALAEAQGVRLDADTSRAGVATVDPEQLAQALDNLVRNALDATPPGGSIAVTAETRPEGHVVTVTDTGRGIAAEHLPRVFDLYFTTKPDGTGVGLAVVHQIVTSHGGTVDIASEVGRGTRVTIALPDLPDSPR